MDGAAEAKVRFKSRYLVDPSAAGDVRAFAQGVVAELTRVQPALMAEVARTVVGCPAGWGEGRREQYAALLESAGFPNVSVVPEPRAAFLYARHARGLRVSPELMRRSAMVIDIGSSTTDFAYIVDGHQQNVSLFGDTNLGGGLIDELILSHAVAQSPDGKALAEVFEECPAWRSYCELEARRLKESYFLDEEKWADAPLRRQLTVCYDEPLALELSIGGESVREMIREPISALGGRSFCDCLEDALHAFLAFAGGRLLAAHNAEFDISFIRAGCKKCGIPFEPTYLDSLIFAQNLLPELGKYKLDIVADHLQLPQFNHHRASDDAVPVAQMLAKFFVMLEERGVTRLQQINDEMTKLRPLGVKRNRFPKHIILIAKNKVGLKNLYQLISASNLKYFKRVPIIPKSELVAHREGLIIGSACEAGELFRAIVDHKDWNELKRIASFYDYLEIQPLGNNRFMVRDGTVRDDEDLKDFNRTVVKLGEELGKPVCATGDVHFLDPEDEVYRHILLASKKFADANEPVPLYFRTTDEMLKEFDYLGKEKAYEVVVTNTRAIAEQVEDIELLPKGKLFPPRLENSEEDLNRMVWGKAHELYGDDLPQLIVDRLNVELGSILGKYDVVYMSAQKLVQRSLECGYLVGSRGSVGSSLVAYMAGITEVNALPPHYRCPKCRNVEFHAGEYGCGADMPDKMCPVCGTKYVKDGFDIPFETFLGYGGGKVPDIDLNFSGEYQARAHAHAVEMFGKTQVFRAGTIGTLAEKTAYGFVKKYLEENGIAAGNAEIDRLTAGCVGVRRTTGQHPGGLVVVPDDMDIEDFCPVQHPADDPDSDTITTHFEYHCMEDNLLKLDMLGHDDPTMIRMLENLTGVNARAIPLDDPDTMSIFISSKVLGYENDEVLGPTGAVAIPEFNTRFTRQMLVDTQPKDFNTLLRLSGFSHGTDVWLGNAKDLIISGTASVLETVGCRDDIMLYLISMGLDPKMSFKIMEAVRKGKVKGGKAGDWPMWVEEMRKHDVPEWYIESLAKIGYLFPKAHAVAYVMMAFRIAWFKVHEPLAFYATFFSIRAKAFDAAECCKDADALRRRIREIENNKDATAVEQDLMTTLEVCYEFCLRGFHFEPIDIYRSDATKFVVTENGLLPPFTSVRGLGETAALDTVEKRKGKDFTSVEEFSLCCNKLSQTHIDQLRALGAFAGLPETSQLTLF